MEAYSKHEASMVIWNSGWIKCNWTSSFHPINFTSFIEEHWSIARPESIQFQFCTSRGHKIDLLISQICYVIVVDLRMLSILSFEPLNSMHYRLSNVDFEFHVQMFMWSILLMCVDLSLAMHISVIYDESSAWWCTQFGFLVKMFLSILSLFMSRWRWWCSSSGHAFDSLLATLFRSSMLE